MMRLETWLPVWIKDSDYSEVYDDYLTRGLTAWNSRTQRSSITGGLRKY